MSQSPWGDGSRPQWGRSAGAASCMGCTARSSVEGVRVELESAGPPAAQQDRRMGEEGSGLTCQLHEARDDDARVLGHQQRCAVTSQLRTPEPAQQGLLCGGAGRGAPCLQHGCPVAPRCAATAVVRRRFWHMHGMAQVEMRGIRGLQAVGSRQEQSASKVCMQLHPGQHWRALTQHARHKRQQGREAQRDDIGGRQPDACRREWG